MLIISGGVFPDEPVAAHWFQAVLPTTVLLWAMPQRHTPRRWQRSHGSGKPR
jgi:hypothetical protein